MSQYCSNQAVRRKSSWGNDAGANFRNTRVPETNFSAFVHSPAFCGAESTTAVRTLTTGPFPAFPGFFRELRWRRGSIAAHQWRWRQRGVVASVEDVTSALNQISREYSDAPGPFERAGVVSLLAKLYADGTVFADNRPRDAEMVSVDVSVF